MLFFFSGKTQAKNPSLLLKRWGVLVCSSACSHGSHLLSNSKKPASLAGCLQSVMWTEAVAQLYTKARIRAGGEAYHEPLLCLDWKGSSSFTPGLFTEASLPQLVGIAPARTAETKSSHGRARSCQPAIDPVRMASNERRNTLGDDMSVVCVCAHNERLLVLVLVAVWFQQRTTWMCYSFCGHGTVRPRVGRRRTQWRLD